MAKPILIVTVTKIEALSVLKTFAPTDDKALKRKSIGKKTYYELGIHGNVPVFMVQSETGSGTPGGTILTVSQAIQKICPQVVIMCGIAFGLRPDKQKLGEILIARQIMCYEPQKVDIDQGRILRGDRIIASARVLDRFRSADYNWTGAKTYFGLVMSGEKLVNDPDIRDWLLQNEPEAVGGEMEGAGLFVNARNSDTEWILVKAICDWGDGTKNNAAQQLAAENAAKFVLHVLQQGGFGKFKHSEPSGDSGNADFVQAEKISKQTFQYENAVIVTAEDENPEILKWLTKVGLKENPFRYQNAEDNDPYFSKYFSRFPDLETVTAQDLTGERKTWFFWGKEGSGKTTLRKFLTARLMPQKTDSDIFGIEVDRVKFEQLVFSIDSISEFITHFIRYVYETCLQKFPVETIKSVSWHNQSDLQENLANLSVSLRQHGINWVLCLIDPSKDFFIWKGSQVSTSSLLAPLLSFPDIGGFGFRYFLPESVKVELQKTLSILPRGQRRLMQIEWDEETINKLIGKRMTILSLDQSAPYRSLGELCDDDKNLSSLIDAEIASLAQGNPRAAIWLANRLIEMHCQLPVPANRISLQTWDEVKRIWWSSVESRMLGVLESSQFRVLGRHIFFQKHEIILSGRSDQLLRSLAKAKGGFCSKEELIMAGWPGENLVGISEKALSEAIRRTKDELKHQISAKGFEEFDWIKSVRKRGYKLVYPGIDTKVGEEDYG